MNDSQKWATVAVVCALLSIACQGKFGAVFFGTLALGFLVFMTFTRQVK